MPHTLYRLGISNIFSRQLWWYNKHHKRILAEDNVTNDSRYRKIYCKHTKTHPRQRFETVLKEELKKLEHKMRVGYSTLRKLAARIKLERIVFECRSSI